MSETTRFCYGCNEKVSVVPVQSQCPHCGEALADLGLAPTLDVDDAAMRETQIDRVDTCEPAADQLVGTTIATYSIEALIGKGGMGRVYRAEHRTLKRLCAVKILNPELVARRPEYVEVFFAEARAAAALVHPHVVTVHTIGHAGDLHFIEMEYVVGRSLRWFVETHGAPSPVHATDLIVQTCSALAEAHRRGLVHRDIKPGNILVSDQGHAKLADFGLAKQVVSAEEEIKNRGLVGTPYFMAPELFYGEPAGPCSDVYALGVTYYFLLTGRLPFVDRYIAEVARKHAEEPVPDPGLPDAAPGLLEVLMRSLAKDIGERYPDASSFHTALRAVYGNLRSTESLVHEALEGLEVDIEGGGRHYTLTVHLGEGRTQRVFVDASQGSAISQRVVKIYSVCGPLRDDFLRRALELNAEIPHGAIAVQELDGRPHFIMCNTYPRATCDPEEIRHSVLTIANYADQVERALTGQDRY